MKIKVNTEKLLLAALNIPDVSPTEMTMKFKNGTHGLHRDFFAGRDPEDVLGLECPELIPVYQEFVAWKRQRGVCFPSPYKQYRSKLRSILKNQGAPEEVQISAYTSIYAVLAVYTDINYFTGYDIKEARRMFCSYLGSTQIRVKLLNAAFLSEISNKLSLMRYDISHWCYGNNPPKGPGSMAIWKANFSQYVEEVIKKYNVPLYYEV